MNPHSPPLEDADDDVDDFLAPPPSHHAQPSSSYVNLLSTSHQQRGDDDDDDDNFFLRRDGPSPRLPALRNEASIVQELEKEAAHWREQYETSQRLRQGDAEREQHWKDALAKELQLLFHHMVVRRQSGEKALRAYCLQDLSDHNSGSSSPTFGGASGSFPYVGTSDVRSFLCDGVLAHVLSTTPSQWVPWEEREEIDRSDCGGGGSEASPSTPLAQRGPSSVASGRSAARILRRQRSVVRPVSTSSWKGDVASSPAAALPMREGGQRQLQDMSALRHWRGSPAAASATSAVEVFSTVLQHHQQAKARTQLVGCSVLAASTSRALMRGAWSKWLQWSATQARRRIPKPVRWRRSLAVLTRDALVLRFVIHGTMASSWRRWHLFVQTRRLQRSVNRLMAQQAAHGTLMGSLIKTQNTMWVQFVEDAAILLEQQLSELQVLDAGGIPQLLLPDNVDA